MSFSSVAWLHGSHTCFAAGMGVDCPNPVLADAEVVDSIPVADYTVAVAAAAPMIAVEEDMESHMEEEVVVVVLLPVATYCHNCRRTGCHSSLALHTGDRDTSAAA